MLRLRLTPCTLPFKRPAATSRGPLAARALWLVAAWDDAAPAVVGMGECGPIPALSADDRPTFLPESVALVDSINGAHVPLPAQAQAWPVALDALVAPWDATLRQLPSLAFGLETALLDLLHGGQATYFASPFTRGAAALPTHGLIWMDTPDGLLAQVEAKVAAGCNVIKMKVGALPFGDEVALLRALRARYPGIELRLDANGAWSPAEALKHLAALAPLGIAFLEQPIAPGQPAALASLCAQSPVPLALDEELIGMEVEAAQSLLKRVRPPHLIVKPALLGGWRATAALTAHCDTLGITWWGNSLLESSIGHDAICQWIGAAGGDRVHGLGAGSLFAANFPSPIRLHGCALQRESPLAGVDRQAITR